MRRRLLIIVTAVLAVLCIGWSLAAPWAAAFPLRADHYKVTLFGVRQISDTSHSCGMTRDSRIVPWSATAKDKYKLRAVS